MITGLMLLVGAEAYAANGASCTAAGRNISDGGCAESCPNNPGGYNKCQCNNGTWSCNSGCTTTVACVGNFSGPGSPRLKPLRILKTE